VRKLSALFVILCVVFGSCKREQNFSVVPYISFVDFTKYGADSAIVRIKFTDGDGDIGLDPTDLSPPYNIGSRYYADLFLVYYYLDPESNTWKVYNNNITNTNSTQFDTMQYTYRIPNLTQSGQNQSLQGEIKVAIPAPYCLTGSVLFPHSPPAPQFMYKITLVDRALHVSNTVQTGPISYP